jgi:signal transduction histidine kinase
VSGRVAELLQVSAEIMQICTSLLDSPETTTDKQRNRIEKIVSHLAQFSSLITEKTDFLESGSSQIHMMGHELRTPISMMMTQEYILVRYLYDPLSEAQQGYLVPILEKTQKIGDLIVRLMSEHAEW